MLPVRYRSEDEDSARWLDFPSREGDIVISTRSKCGTTWCQMICALLVFQQTELPAPLHTLSPWLDFLVTPREEVYALLEQQQHRRFIKTHTPLDGLPIVPQATYIVVLRHPLDMAVSLYHQGNNLDREKLFDLIGKAGGGNSTAGNSPASPRPELREWLLSWIDSDADPREELDSLPGVLWHLSDAWERRDEPNVILLNYSELSDDLEGQMRRLASLLSIEVPEETWPELVRAAGFERMKASADMVAPGGGVLKDNRAFFRRGSSGAGRELLTDAEYDHYLERAAQRAHPDALAWLHQSQTA